TIYVADYMASTPVDGPVDSVQRIAIEAVGHYRDVLDSHRFPEEADPCFPGTVYYAVPYDGSAGHGGMDAVPRIVIAIISIDQDPIDETVTAEAEFERVPRTKVILVDVELHSFDSGVRHVSIYPVLIVAHQPIVLCGVELAGVALCWRNYDADIVSG